MDLLAPKASTPEFYSPTFSVTNYQMFMLTCFSLAGSPRQVAGPTTFWSSLGDIQLVPQPWTPSVRNNLSTFDIPPDLDALAEAQGVRPIENIDDLVGDFWPEDENVEDFIAAATEGRHEEEHLGS